MKSEVYKRKVDIADELLAGSLDAAGSIKRGGDRLRRTARHLDTRGEFRPRQTRQLPRAADLKGRLLS